MKEISFNVYIAVDNDVRVAAFVEELKKLCDKYVSEGCAWELVNARKE